MRVFLYLFSLLLTGVSSHLLNSSDIPLPLREATTEMSTVPSLDSDVLFENRLKSLLQDTPVEYTSEVSDSLIVNGRLASVTLTGSANIGFSTDGVSCVFCPDAPDTIFLGAPVLLDVDIDYSEVNFGGSREALTPSIRLLLIQRARAELIAQAFRGSLPAGVRNLRRRIDRLAEASGLADAPFVALENLPIAVLHEGYWVDKNALAEAGLSAPDSKPLRVDDEIQANATYARVAVHSLYRGIRMVVGLEADQNDMSSNLRALAITRSPGYFNKLGLEADGVDYIESLERAVGLIMAATEESRIDVTDLQPLVVQRIRGMAEVRNTEYNGYVRVTEDYTRDRKYWFDPSAKLHVMARGTVYAGPNLTDSAEICLDINEEGEGGRPLVTLHVPEPTILDVILEPDETLAHFDASLMDSDEQRRVADSFFKSALVSAKIQLVEDALESGIIRLSRSRIEQELQILLQELHIHADVEVHFGFDTRTEPLGDPNSGEVQPRYHRRTDKTSKNTRTRQYL